MKSKVLLSITIILLLFLPKVNYGQAPAIGTQPTDQIVCEGASATFSVAATGTALTYQWRKGIINLVDGGNILGSATATLIINPTSVSDASSDYNVIVSGSIAPNDTSDNAVLDVNTAPNITLQPTNQVICAGDTVRFSVVATGVNLNYQWRNGATDLVSGGNILDATAATLVIYPATIADTSSFYNVVITGGCPPTATSTNASLFINTGPHITTQPSNQAICAGSSASFSVAATGASLNYQWVKSGVNLINGGNISGANTATLVINPVTVLDTSSNYYVIVSGACLPNDTSIKVSLRFNNPHISIQPSNQTVCSGNPAIFSVTAIGTGLIYQWRKGTVNLVDVGNISGATTATLVINPATISDTSSFYNVFIIGGCAPNDTSINVSLFINTSPNITTQPTSQTVCAGNPAIFTVGATGTGLIYQWRNGNVSLVNSGNISGVNTATLTINPANISDTSSFYNVVITGVCAPNDTSIKVSLKINTAPNITTQPSNQTICSGSSASFVVVSTGTGLIYQWKNGNVNLVNGGNISGANTTTLTINPATISDTSSFYHVIITGGCPPKDSSVYVSLRLNTAPNITTQPVSQSVCPGSLASFSVGVTGAGLTYQWRRGNINLINGGNFSGVNTSSLVINPTTFLDTASNYNVIVTGTCAPNDTSIYVYLRFNNPKIIIQPTSQTICDGSAAIFSVSATGTGLIYQWKKGNLNLVNGGNISGATTATLVVNPATISDTSSFYNVIVIGACAPNDTSIKVSLHVNPLPTVTANASTTTVCAGSSVILNGGGAISYTWTNGVTNGVAFVPASTNTYTVTGTNGNNCSNTATITVTVNNLPAAAPTSNSPVCIGGVINLSTATVSGATYNWSGPNAFTSIHQDTSISSATLANAGTYTLTVSNNGCSSNATITVIVNNCVGTDLSVIKTVNNTHPIIGNTVVFVVTVTNNGPNVATGVNVNDILQSGYTYVTSTITTGTYNPSVGVWTIGALNNGSSAVLTVTVTVVAMGNYVNTAVVYGNEVDPNMTNNNASVETFPTDFFIPEGFSPNGDGINDLYVIRGVENYPHNIFTVFNRWGNKVYSASPYQSTWDGKSTDGMKMGGDDLPVGTYFYILDLGDGSKVFKGSIYLNK